MGKEISFPLTDEMIGWAESHRAVGNLLAAIEATATVMEFPLEGFSSLPKLEQIRFLQALRIYVVANISQANEQYAAPLVAESLEAAREGIVRDYRDQAVVKAAEIKEDTRGIPYEFGLEMARDEVGYTLVLFGLTGSTEFLDEAIETMEMIIERASEPTLRTLTKFELARLVYEEDFDKSAFAYLKDTCEEALATALAAKNFERATVINARYTISVIRGQNWEEAIEGVKKIEEISQKSPSAGAIFNKIFVKEFSREQRQGNWRRTIPPDVNYSSTLRLPS